MNVSYHEDVRFVLWDPQLVPYTSQHHFLGEKNRTFFLSSKAITTMTEPSSNGFESYRVTFAVNAQPPPCLNLSIDAFLYVVYCSIITP